MGIDISSAYIYSAFQLHKHTISTTRETQLLTHLSLVYDSVYHSLKHNQQTSTLSRTSLNTSFSSPTETKCFSNSQATNHAPCPEHLKDHPATELEARPKMPAGRRRSSAGSETKFAGLNAMKRSSVDERRANWADQKPGSPGMLQGMWNSFTKGT